VTVTAGGVAQLSEVRSGSSYLSQNDLRLHFGLGKETSMNTVEVSWPSGKKETYKDLAADFIYTIVEDSGVQQKVPLEK
jgi:enediyne biosynthesis protein E4